MPNPHSRHRPTPDDLARQIAGQIASKKPPKPRYRLRDSVFVGRLIAGATALAVCAVILTAILFGSSWWAEQSTAAEVLATEITISSDDDHQGVKTSHADPPGIHAVGQPWDFRLAGATLISTPPWPLPQLPAPTTTLPATVTGPPTTAQQVPSSTSTPSTAVPTTAPQGQPTTSAPTTTTPVTTTTPSTPTTLPGATTTIPSTTTTAPGTTTTCAGNSGGGNGNGPCGP